MHSEISQRNVFNLFQMLNLHFHYLLPSSHLFQIYMIYVY